MTGHFLPLGVLLLTLADIFCITTSATELRGCFLHSGVFYLALLSHALYNLNLFDFLRDLVVLP